MLKISGTGWAEISIDSRVVFRASYVTDVPCDFMKALYDYLMGNEIAEREARPSSSVYADCEGGAANFVFSDMIYSGNGQKVFMFFSSRNGWEIEAFNDDPLSLAKELICDVDDDFENWVKWYGYNDNSHMEDLRRENLTYWLNNLKDAVKKTEH